MNRQYFFKLNDFNLIFTAFLSVIIQKLESIHLIYEFRLKKIIRNLGKEKFKSLFIIQVLKWDVNMCLKWV